jgi:glycosyltransferase involved in cell wall biosynthesis
LSSVQPETPASLVSGAAVETLQIGLGSAGEVAGGAERVFAELEAHLPDCGIGFCPAVVTGSVSGNPDQSRHVFAPPGAGTRTRMLGARRVLGQLLKQKRFDLVASHFALYALPALDLIRKHPFVVHFHGPWAAESLEEGSGRAAAYAKYWLEKLVYGSSDRVIVLSHAFARVVIEDYGVPEEQVRVVPGSVDVERFAVAETKQQARQILGWPVDRPILLSVRRLSHRMGLDLLIDALPAIVKAHPDVLLYIGGKGHMREELERRVADYGLGDHVRFLGFVSEELLPLAYRAADLNIVPTRAWEGFGLVAAEAIAAGTPSLVTPVGGLPEVVAPLSQALVFRSVSSGDIGGGIIEALSGAANIPDASCCRTFAAAHFSSRLMASRTAAVYRELLENY